MKTKLCAKFPVKAAWGMATIVTLLVGLLPGVLFGAGTPAFIQEQDNRVSAGQTLTVTASSPTTSGNLVVVYVVWDNTNTVVLTDSAGNSYANASGPKKWNGNKYCSQIFYAKNIQGGPDTVSATFATAINTFAEMFINEYSGMDPAGPFDKSAAATGASGSLHSGSVTTTRASDLLFAAGASATSVTAPGRGYTVRAAGYGDMIMSRNVSTRGIYAATAGNGGGAWVMQSVAFKAVIATPDKTVPTVPAGLSATAVSSSQINLAWSPSTDNVGVTGYRVYRNGSQIATTASTNYSDTGLAAGKTFTYAVAAFDPAGNVSAKSATASATTPSWNYTTTFPLTENPISEGGHWLNGATTGLDWSDIQTKPGLAFGTQTGNGEYNDSIANLAGIWGADQTAQATVRIVSSDSAQYEEVELHLRRSLSAHNATGYEINFSVKPKNPYIQIVRWNGALGDWTELNDTIVGVKNGDVVAATIAGNLITAYVNGTNVLQATDGTFTTGSPGMGFYLQNGSSNFNADFGFSSFKASDGSGLTP